MHAHMQYTVKLHLDNGICLYLLNRTSIITSNVSLLPLSHTNWVRIKELSISWICRYLWIFVFNQKWIFSAFLNSGIECMSNFRFSSITDFSIKILLLWYTDNTLNYQKFSTFLWYGVKCDKAQAADAGSIEIARLLLDKGANSNAYGRSGKFPLYLAARSQSSNSVDILKLLIERGADVNLKYVNGMF